LEFYDELFKHWHLRPGVVPDSLPIVLNLDESDDEGQDFSTLFVIKDEYEEIPPQESASPAKAATPVTPQAEHMEDSGAAAELEVKDLRNDDNEKCVEGKVGEEQTLGDGGGAGGVTTEVDPDPVEVTPQLNLEILEASEPDMDEPQEDQVDADPYPEPEPETAAASAPELNPIHGKQQQDPPLETTSSDDVEQRIALLKFLALMFSSCCFSVHESIPR